MAMPLPPDVPADAVAVIYYCHVCKGKHTFGPDYFTEVGTPDKCPNCGTSFEQRDKILRTSEDTDDQLDEKRDNLHRRRGEKIPKRERPADPEATKKARVKELRDEIDRLEGRDPKQPKDPKGIKLGP